MHLETFIFPFFSIRNLALGQNKGSNYLLSKPGKTVHSSGLMKVTSLGLHVFSPQHFTCPESPRETRIITNKLTVALPIPTEGFADVVVH